ncbi:variant erythrocyte surface antigen-1 family protein [Babesia caballi]|uniref:Variant erythrocyte surface antigen-1 family protein n=1 Tax=Babesia caballi TaxID=5871 RepID=A0AAV4LZA2_BABCB|nr:variant erythrocyte surface antigen-1 family protein [Babesia caballi]
MTAGQKSLTQPPTNLKEAIDWVLCMSGNDVVGGGEGKQAIQKLAKEVMTLLINVTVGEHPVGNVHGQHIGTLLQGDASSSHTGNFRPIQSLGNGLRALIGYGSGILNGNGIGAKEKYTSSYSDQNPSTSVDSEEVAKRFLGFIPLIFFALSFLYWQCQGQWKTSTLGDGPLRDFLVKMGFPAEQLNEEKEGSDVSAMFNGLDELKNVNPTPTLPAFLQKVEEKGKNKFKFMPSRVPLYTLCLIALTYIAKTSDALSTDKIPQTKGEIIDTLNKLSEAVKSPPFGAMNNLSAYYEKLEVFIIEAIKSTESTSSSGAAAAGGVLGTAAIGGTAAALATNPPTNLKEAIDWLALVGGGFGGSGCGWGKHQELEKALEKLPGFRGIKEKVFGNTHPQGAIKALANGFAGFLGHSGQGTDGFSGRGIVKKGGGYESAYDGAQWQEGQESDYALIFLGSAYVTYYFVTFLYWACSNNYSGPWKGLPLQGHQRPGIYLKGMGFYIDTLVTSQMGYTVAQLLDSGYNGFTELNVSNSYFNNLTYSEFLTTLQQKAPTDAINFPLTCCYLLARDYFNLNKSSEVTEVIKQIRSTFEGFKGNQQDLQVYSTLITNIKKFFENVKMFEASTFPPLPPQPPQSGASTTSSSQSPAGPAVGGLLGVGALGAGAAYGLNLVCRGGPGGSRVTLPSILPRRSLFDCPFNLKEAIDWILRVTGKDGGGGDNGGTAALTNNVKELLKEVKGSGTELGLEIEKVIRALGVGSDNLITKLADGLRQFIGYDSQSSTTPIITGGGILTANVARYQVCNAVLNFVIRFLEGLSKVNEASYKQNVSNAIVTLLKCVGTGKVPKGFGTLVEGIGNKVKEGFDSKIKQSGMTNDGVLNTVFSALKEITDQSFKTEHPTHNVKNDTDNVKNYIDAVKNDLKEDGSGNFKSLNDRLKTLFGDVKTKVTSQPSETNHIDTDGLTNFKKVKPDSINGDINQLKTNTKFKDYANAAVFTAVRDAATAFIAELQTKTYTSYYNKAEWSNVSSDDDKTKCAKIFLGCLPLYYQALTYIYWGCHEKGGGWRNLTFAGGALRFYFDSQGLLPTFVESSRTGAHIADSALKVFQTEFSKGMAATSSSTFTYASFTKELREKVSTQSSCSDCPLSALFHGASCYFQCQQIKVADKASRSPQTIREMLYFLAALQFSPQYDAFDSYVTSHFNVLLGNKSQNKNDSELKLQVAVSGSSKTGETLSAADLKSYITSTFLLPPSLLGWLQEPSTSDEPWLHSLFSNSQFKLSIPSSGAGIFSALSNYAYALQFQLSFLYIQCRNTYTVGCGWQECKFGQKINESSKDAVVASHICPTGCTSGEQHSSGDHSQGGCQHANCGTTKASPLQAFLTDKLIGFSRGHPSDPSSHLGSCSGSLCHVPMGFDGKLCAEASSGLNIAYALGSFCGGFNTPLRQLSEKLGCLTKRTPRTLGDLFGFLWHLNGQLFATLNNITSAGWFGELKDKLPFSYQLKSDSGQKLKTFVGTAHTDSNSHSTADLTSLYSLKCDQQGLNCGPYLYPLTHSDGATYAPRNAFTYLSWVLYLTDELYESLQEFLDTFNGHACKNCTHRCAHSTASPCSCP